MVWRSDKDSATWHYNTNCFEWPTEDYIEVTVEPKDGYICEICYELYRIDNDDRYDALRYDGVGYDEFEIEGGHRCQ